MKSISKMLLLGSVAAAALVALLAALFLLMPGGGEDSAEASGGTGNPPTIFGIDVDPSGNSCVPPDEDTSTDGYCTLGTIEQCIRVESTETGTYPGPIFEVDVFLDDIPNGKDLAGGDWFMHYDSAHLKVNRILPSPARCNAWLLGMKLGSGCADNGEKPTVALPDTNGILNVSMVDGNGQVSAELPTVAGQDRGVLDRYELAVTAAGPALAQITFVPAPTYFASSSVGRYDPTQVWDANYTPPYGLIAIDRDCPAAAEPADLEKVDLTASGLPANSKGGSEPDVDVGVDVPFTLTETVKNNGDATPVIAKITTTCTAPSSTPASQCSYHVKAGDSPDGDLEVRVDGGAAVINPAAGTWFHGGTIQVVQRKSLAKDGQIVIDKDWDLNCGEPSTHTWGFQNTVAPNDPIANPDPNPNNNSKSLDVTVECWAQSNVSVTQQMFAGNCLAAPPTELPQGSNVNVCVHKTIANAGPYTGNIAVSITHGAVAEGTCTATAALGNPTSKIFSGASTTVDEIWTLNCPNTGEDLTFTFNNAIAVTTAHVTDPITPNLDSEDLTVDVTATADARIVSWVFPPDELDPPAAVGPAESGDECENAIDDDADTVVNDGCPDIAGNQVLVDPGTAEDLDTTETLDNIPGAPHTTYTGTEFDVDIDVAVTPDANCAATPDAVYPLSATLQTDGSPPTVDTHTWSVNLTSGDSCTIDFDKDITITETGVNEYDLANNSAAATVILVADTDGDGVPDNYGGLNDNCDDDINPDQADNDDDGQGDVCDTDDDDDGVLDVNDNCVLIANAGQEDADTDDIGNVCELDVNCSGGGPNGADALAILQRILGRVGLDPTQCPAPNGDLYAPRASAYVAYDPAHPELVGNGRDALMILQCILGRHNIVCPAPPAP